MMAGTLKTTRIHAISPNRYGEGKPVVFVSTGFDPRPMINEVTRMLRANQAEQVAYRRYNGNMQ